MNPTTLRLAFYGQPIRQIARHSLTRPRRFLAGPTLCVLLSAISLTVAADEDVISSQDVIVVTATRTQLPISRVGSSVSVLDHQALSEQQQVRVFEVMSQLPGISVANSEGVAPRIHIRGAPFEHTLVLIDGVRMTMPSFRRSEAINTITADNIERIEVLRGPQSTLYGGDAAAGVINIITRRGEGATAGSFSVEYGSWATRKLNATARGSAGRFDYSVEGGLFRSDWYSVGDPQGRADARAHETASARLGYQMSDDWRAEGIFRWIETDREDDHFDQDADRRNEESDYAARLQLSRAPEHGAVSSLFAISLSGNRSQGFEEGVARNSRREQQILQVDYQNDLMLSPTATLTFGGEYNEQSVSGGIFEQVAPDDIQNHAGFLQWQGEFGGLIYTVGGRYDDNSDFGGFPTYRLTAAYSPDRMTTRFRGNIGTGFRTPSMSQLTGTSSCPNGNPALEPEENLAIELGLVQPLGNFLAGSGELEISAFRNRITNVIVGSACLGGSPLENKDRRDADGLELSTRWRPVHWLSLHAHYTYLDARDRVDGRSSRAEGIPRHTASFGLRYYHGLRFNAGFNAVYNAGRLDPPAKLGGYTLVNASAELQLTETWSVFGRVDNFLDEDYQTTRRAQTANRNMHIGIRVRF